MADISSPHDSFFRSLLADSRMALDYFKSALPDHIIQLLDLTTLERVPDSYVSGELEKAMSDVVYRCRRRDGKGSVSVCLLVEHKSRLDKYTPVQVGGYIFSGYQLQISQGQKELTPIIPILFYHGRQKWEYWTLDRLFGKSRDELLGFIPKFEYIYHNLRDTPEAAIQAIGNQFLVSALLTLKYTFDKRKLKERFHEILVAGLTEGNDDQHAALLVYSLGRVDYTEEQIEEFVKELPLTIKNRVMSTYDLLIRKGLRQGIEQGIAKGEEQKSYEFVRNLIQSTTFTEAKIASLAVVSTDFVKKVRADLNKKKK